jgi:hypothetical protein
VGNENIKITLDKSWADRFERMATIAEAVSDSLLRVATSLEKLAEMERQKHL